MFHNADFTNILFIELRAGIGILGDIYPQPIDREAHKKCFLPP